MEDLMNLEEKIWLSDPGMDLADINTWVQTQAL